MRDAMAFVAPKDWDCISLVLNLDSLNQKAKQIEALFQVLENLLEIPLFQFQQAAMSSAQFIDVLERVGEHARAFNRMCLLVAGGNLDEHVTAAMLALLAKGLDVYLLHDVLICGQPKFEQVFLQRLVQAGAVPTTLGQCLFQWALSPENEDKRKAVMDLAKELALIVG